jgi:putative hemolysin
MLPAAFLFAVVALLLQSSVFAQDAGPKPDAPPPENIVRNLIFVFFLILFGGLFAMAEAALLSVRRTRIDQLVEEGNRAAQVAAQLLNEPTRMLSTLQVGVTLVGLFSAGAAADTAVEPFKKFLQDRFQNTFIAHSAGVIAFVTIILAVSLLTLVVGEISPKSIAIRHAERIALLSAYPLRWLQFLTTPIVWLVTELSGVLVRPFGVTAGFHPTAMSEDELRLLVEQSEEHGVIEAEEKKMIHSIFDFADTVVRKVMTPRLDITAIEADVNVDELIRVVTESGHSRLPVYDDNLDSIVGIVHVKDVLQSVTDETTSHSIRELMRPPYFIPENKRVDDLLREFRRSRIQLAVVRDEFGTVVGVVTIEDLVEEIVGDIQDEYDTEEEPPVVQVDERTSIVDGKMSLEDFNDRMGVELPMEEADTLGGFIFGLLGHQPAQGETVVWDGLEFRVEATDGKRIQKVRVTHNARPEDAPGEDGAVPPDAPPAPRAAINE